MNEYQRRLDLALSMGILDRGTVNLAKVRHDSWCGSLSGGECNCDPDISIRTQGGRMFWVQKDGTVSSIGPVEGR